jgi:hypothetical protein
MKTFIGAAVIAAALAPWQPNAYAATMVATDVEVQPLTRAACDKVGFAWDDNGNVCDWQPQEQVASELITEAVASNQPLTRAACDKVGFAWDDNGNVCDWQSQEQVASEPITEAVASNQPLTRAACDKVGFAWDDNGNVCDWKSAESQSSPNLEIASKPQRATKQSARVNGHTTRKYTHRQLRQTQVLESRPFPLFRLFRD